MSGTIDVVEELRIWSLNVTDKAVSDVLCRAADTVEKERAQRAIANSSWHRAGKEALAGDTHALQCWVDAAEGKI